MDLSVSPKDEIWSLRVCHHISTGLYQGYSATKRPAVSLACWSQATIFTVLPLHKICSVTAHLLISISLNPLIQAESEGSLEKRLALLSSSMVPHPPGFAWSTSRSIPLMHFSPLCCLCVFTFRRSSAPRACFLMSIRYVTRRIPRRFAVFLRLLLSLLR